MPEDPMERSMNALSAYFVADSSLGDVLEKICDAALEAVGPAVLAGLSMTVDARIGTYVFTSPEVQEIDKAQYDTGDGPCVDAFRTGQPVTIDATCEPGPYPRFRQSACAHGMLSVLSSPLNTPSQTVGALNVYATEVRAFTAAHQQVLATFAGHAAYVLLNHQAYWDARSLSENLQQALRSRAEIEQAKGIIMASVGCSADDAFEHLKQQSQAENIRLREIAHEVVTRARRRE